MRAVAFPLFFALTASSSAQTLDSFLKGYKADRLLAVAPETVTLKEGSGLAAFGRKAFRTGTITAIVPTTVAAFDDVLAAPPNRYAGLPRRSKVVLLLSLIGPAGLKKAAGPRGIGEDDLAGEARSVFLSLLPQPLAWERRKIDYRGHAGEAIGTGELPYPTKVRLRIERSLQFQVPLNEQGGGFLSVPTDGAEGIPGESQLRRQESHATESDEVFGLPMRRNVDNRPKNGQLDTRSLRRPVALPEKATVGEALRRVGRASGKEILCDLRVRDLSVYHRGGPVPAGDLADGLALAVGGTYRKVGPAYALVSDVVGLGQRQLRQVDWRETAQDKADAAEAKWRATIQRPGLLDGVPYDGSNPLSPSEALLPYLGLRPAKDSSNVPVSALTPEQRGLLDRAGIRASFPRRPETVGLGTSLRYRFVLPDGQALQPERDDLGVALDPKPSLPPGDVESASPLPELAECPAKTSIIVRLNTGQEAATVLREARAHGIEELWVETESPQALKAAMAGGMRVHLVVRPWAWRIAKRPQEPDRNILGHGGKDLLDSLAADREWSRRTRSGLSGNRPPEVTVSPDDPSWPARKKAWQTLAATPGLAGVVVLDSQPRGYEPGRTAVIAGGYGATLATKAMLGYTESERLAFFRAHGVDPIDMGYEMLRTDVDLRPPFFSDEGLAGWKTLGEPTSPAMATLLAEWDKFRWKRNVAAMDEMLLSLPKLPCQIAVRAPAQNEPLGSVSIVEPWTPGKPLPAMAPNEPRPGGREVYTVVESSLPEFRAYGKVVVDSFQEGHGAILDFTLVPAKGIGTCLDKIFTRRKPD